MDATREKRLNLNTVDIIDKENSQAYYSSDFLKFRTKMYLRDTSYMNGHLLAMIKECELDIIVHPLLAKHFIKSKGTQFLTDEEVPI